MRRRPIPAAAAALLLGLLAMLGPVAGARASVRAERAAATPRAEVQDAEPLPAGAEVAGTLAPSAPISLTVALGPRDPAALAAYAAAVSDPNSALHGDYLSVSQFAARFGASDAAAATVASALRQSGLAVGALSPNGLSLTASGSAAEIGAAFDTNLSHVELSNGASAYTDTTDPTLPAAAAELVEGVAGLDSLPLQAPQGLAAHRGAEPAAVGSPAVASPAAASTPGTCASAVASGGNTAQQIASAYGLNGLWSQGDLGAGMTVALYELEPYTASDVAAYQSCYGTSVSVGNVTVDTGASCGTDSTCGVEDVLDIEDVAGLAPGAAIKVYEGPNSGTGAYDTYQAIVQADTAQVISSSWGTCEANQTTSALRSENTLFQEAATQGQSLFAATGDEGADDCAKGTHAGTAAVDDPGSQPYVTGVGGTTLPSSAAPANETVWNNGYGAAGGGVSRHWTQPSYQSGHALAQSGVTCGTRVTSCREVPDVSADADPATGYAVYYNGGWKVYGGTSAAAPTWAALITLADSSSYCTSHSFSVGFANPTLYASSGDFYDVSSGDNSFGGVTGYVAGTGYDMASGLGAPDGSLLVPALCGASAGTVVPPPTTTPPPTPTTPTPTTTTTVSPTPPPTPTTTTVGPTPTPTPTPPTPPTATTAPTSVTPTSTTGATPTSTGHTDAAVQYVVPRRRGVRIGARVRQPLPAHDRLGLMLHYSAVGLPPGLRITRATGTVSGRPRRTGTFTSSITATDTAHNAQSVVIRWTIAPRARRARHQVHHAPAPHRHHSTVPNANRVIRIGFW